MLSVDIRSRTFVTAAAASASVPGAMVIGRAPLMIACNSPVVIVYKVASPGSPSGVVYAAWRAAGLGASCAGGVTAGSGRDTKGAVSHLFPMAEKDGKKVLLTKHRNRVQFSRIRTRVRQVGVRYVWALPRFFSEICCPNGSSGHSQRSYPGKESRILPFDKMGNITVFSVNYSILLDAVG